LYFTSITIASNLGETVQLVTRDFYQRYKTVKDDTQASTLFALKKRFLYEMLFARKNKIFTTRFDLNNLGAYNTLYEHHIADLALAVVISEIDSETTLFKDNIVFIYKMPSDVILNKKIQNMLNFFQESIKSSFIAIVRRKLSLLNANGEQPFFSMDINPPK
jgi:hypothetical protein